jgi:hypothetical protein
MKDSTRVMRCQRRAWPRTARIVAAIIPMAALALLAACSSSQSSTASPTAAGSANSTSAVAYSRCIRSHGVPDFPDPSGSGGVPKGSAQEYGVSSSQYRVAQTACAHLLSGSVGSIQQCETTGDCPQAVVQQALSVMRKYARCMRSHGLPNFPDPTIGSEGRPFFDVSRAGITIQYTHSSLFGSKDRECERLVGGSAGVPVPLG